MLMMMAIETSIAPANDFHHDGDYAELFIALLIFTLDC